RRSEVLAHFREFERTRVGVEAYIEPATNVTGTTMVLIDFQGEWTRRAIPHPGAGVALAKDLGIPVYDVNLTGYPQRMRDWNARQRIERDGVAGRLTTHGGTAPQATTDRPTLIRATT